MSVVRRIRIRSVSMRVYYLLLALVARGEIGRTVCASIQTVSMTYPDLLTLAQNSLAAFVPHHATLSPRHIVDRKDDVIGCIPRRLTFDPSYRSTGLK